MFLMPGSRARFRRLLPIGHTRNVATLQTDPDVSFFRGYLAGMNLSNDGTSPNTVLDISAGVCADSTASVLMKLPTALTKSTGGTFVPGSGNNGMGRGLTIANTTWYHVFEIDLGVSTDVYFDTSVTAANAPVIGMPFRRIGSFLTDGSAHITTFVQNGDRFYYAPVNDYSSTASRAVALLTLSTVPTGVVVEPLMVFQFQENAGGDVSVFVGPGANSALDYTVLSTNLGSDRNYAAITGPATNTSAQVFLQVSILSGTLSAGTVQSRGYIDTRGRNA